MATLPHVAPAIVPVLPRAETLRMRDGTAITMRRVDAEDKARLFGIFGHLSAESRNQRFMAGIATLSESQLRYLTELDHRDHEAWIAVDSRASGDVALGVARYVRLRGEPDVAEVAVAVIDDHHGLGLGTALLAMVSRSAAEHGIRTFRAHVFDTNMAMIQIFAELGATIRSRDANVLCLEIPVARDAAALPDTPAGAALRRLVFSTPANRPATAA